MFNANSVSVNSRVTTYIRGHSRLALQPILHCHTITTAVQLRISIVEYHGMNNEIEWKLAKCILLLRKRTISRYLPFKALQKDEGKKTRDSGSRFIEATFGNLYVEKFCPYIRNDTTWSEMLLKIFMNFRVWIRQQKWSIGEIECRKKETKRKKDADSQIPEKTSTFSPVR